MPTTSMEMDATGGGTLGEKGEWKTAGLARKRLALARSEIDVRTEVVWGAEKMVESNNWKQLAIWLNSVGVTHEGWMIPRVVNLTDPAGPYKVLRFWISDKMLEVLTAQAVSFTVRPRREKSTNGAWLPAVGEELKDAPRVSFFAQGLVPGQRDVDMAQVVYSVWQAFKTNGISPMIEGVETFYGKGRCHVNVKGMMVAPDLVLEFVHLHL
ncbi:hypothetical protein HDU67_004578, partial [Dinochytrium kinnereticum]